MAPDLNALLRARSIAVVGASARRDSFGWHVVRQLLDFRYPGDVYPVNPRYSDIEGLPCLPSLSEVPAPVDLAAICVADDRMETAMIEAAGAGVRAAVIFGTAAGTEAGHVQLTARLTAIAREADIALMGGSCMGFFNFVDRLFVTGYPYHREPSPGGITFITHSGSTLSAVAKNTRDMTFNYVISPGQELVLTAADYLAFALDQPETRVVGLFLEAIRNPGRFLSALETAEARRIPVVMLKVGRSERGAQMALAHTGALAGAHAPITAVANRYGVTLVRTMEEMLDTLELFAAGRWATTSGLGAITDSGGERGMMVDLASDLGVLFADLSDQTLMELAEHLDPGLVPGNPADLWGSGRHWQRNFRACIDAMLNDPVVGAFNFGIDFNIGSRLGPDYRSIAIDAFQSTDMPFAVVNNVAAGLNPDDARLLREAGIPVLQGTETGLLAFGHSFRYADHVTRQHPVLPGAPAVSAETRAMLRHNRPLTEEESLSVLAGFGLAVVPFQGVDSVESAVAAARSLGYPVVLKTAMPGVLHKSDRGGVLLNLQSDASVQGAYRDLNARFGPRVLIQSQVDLASGVELILGLTVDPQFGPLVTVGLGGIWVEIIDDALVFLAPCSAVEVVARLPDLRGYRMLTGMRGRKPVDLPALGRQVEQFSAVGAALVAYVSEVDVNPVIARGAEFVMLDALVVPSVPDPAAGVE